MRAGERWGGVGCSNPPPTSHQPRRSPGAALVRGGAAAKHKGATSAWRVGRGGLANQPLAACKRARDGLALEAHFLMEGEAVGCHNFSGCDQYRAFLTTLSSWGSPRGLKGWMYAGDR
jgi:hypothetical protein